MMTLEEAINHAEEKAKCGGRCGEEHEQLAEWLKELKGLRSAEMPCALCRYYDMGEAECLLCPEQKSMI